MASIGSLLVFVVLVFCAAASGAVFATGPWYAALSKPWWTPPDWVFPVAWTVLYAMIAAAGWFVWKAGGWSSAVIIWGIGLVLNALWSYLMFGKQDIFAALIDVTGLWLATGAFVFLAWPLDHRASYMFMVYWVWVTFAAALNFAVWRMNS